MKLDTVKITRSSTKRTGRWVCGQSSFLVRALVSEKKKYLQKRQMLGKAFEKQSWLIMFTMKQPSIISRIYTGVRLFNTCVTTPFN